LVPLTLRKSKELGGSIKGILDGVWFKDEADSVVGVVPEPRALAGAMIRTVVIAKIHSFNHVVVFIIVFPLIFLIS
jgi:hypothetical protein